jgi:hypothetical protein
MWGWEKKLLYYGYEKGRFLRIRDALKNDNIYYEVQIRDVEKTRLMSFELIFGTLGRERISAEFCYYIYVHKKDLERAEYWVRRTP